MKKYLLTVIIVLLVPFSAVSLEQYYGDPLFLQDIPITYGEEAFLQRIHARTGGEREPVGLVLSGGSARAFAHIGVLRFLEEQGIVPDFIVSNSMGSIVGLLYSAGFSPDQIYRIVDQTPMGGLFRMAVPVHGGLLDTSRFVSLLAAYTKDLRLETLPIPIMVICEDLVTKRQVRITEGDFLEVLQASFALPVYFPPVPYRDHLLVDGGISNLVPLSPAYEYTTAVIASTAFYQNPDLDLTNPLTILNVSLDITKGRKGVEEIKHYKPMLIRAAVEHFSFMEFDRLEALSEAGYQSAAMQFDPEPFLMHADGDLGVTEELAAIRLAHEGRISGLLTADRIPAYKPSWNLYPKLRIRGTPSGKLYLSREAVFSLDVEGTWRYATASLYGGGAWDAASWSMHPAIGTEVIWLPAEGMTFQGGAEAWLAGYNSISRIYGYGMLTIRAGILPLSAGGGFEYLGDLSTDATSTLLSAWVGAGAGLPENGMIYLEAGYQLEDLISSRVYGDGTFRLPAGDRMTLENRTFGHASLDGSPVPIYPADGLRTSGSPSSWAAVDTVRLLFGFPGFRPTFGELLIFRDAEAGVYGEGASFGALSWGAGVEASLAVSFIGLNELILSASLGYDSGKEGVHARITISN